MAIISSQVQKTFRSQKSDRVKETLLKYLSYVILMIEEHFM